MRSFVVGVAMAVGSFGLTQAVAKDLYVRTTQCSDDTTYANNSATNAWCSPQRALCGSSSCMSPNASEAAKAGDTVLISPGVYFVGQGTEKRYRPALNPANSGTASNPIRIKRNGSGRVDLRLSGGRGPVFGVCGLPECGPARDYIIWDGMFVEETFTQNVSVTDTGPVVIWKTTGSQLLNSELIGNNLTERFDNHTGIRVETTTNILIRNNIVRGFRTGGAAHNGACFMMYYSSNVTIENNEMVDCGSGIYPKGMNDHIVVRYNYVHDNNEGLSASEQDPNGTGCITFHNNLAVNNKHGAYFWGRLGCMNMVNNTFHNNQEGIAPWDNEYGPWTSVRWYNNLVTGNGQTGIYAANLDITTGGHGDYNLVHGPNKFGQFAWTSYNQPAFSNLTGWEANTLAVNPLYVDAAGGNFLLQPNSPARNAGRDILDLDGDGSTNDSITLGAFVTGQELIGLGAGSVASGCGNGVIDGNEQCDGFNFNGQTCSNLGLGDGALLCTPSCTLNTSGCVLALPPPENVVRTDQM